MTTQEKIRRFEQSIDAFTKQIEKIINTPGVGLSSFILTCCLIDTVSNYTIAKNKEYNNVTYKRFINDYLGKVDTTYLDSDVQTRIYKGIRCALVHSFSIGEGILLGELKNKTLHNTFDTDLNYILDLESFYNNVKDAINNYLIPDLKADVVIQRRFINKFAHNRLFGVFNQITAYSGDSETLSGETINPSTSLYTEMHFRNI